MTKVFSEKELVKRLLKQDDTLMGIIHYKSVSLKKDGVLVLFQMKVELEMKDIFLKYKNKPVPYIILSPKEKIEEIIKEIEFEKKEDVNNAKEKI